MAQIKIYQPYESGLGTTVQIDGKDIHRVTSVDYHVSVNENPEVKLCVNGTTEIDLNAEYIKLDISPENVRDAVIIFRNELLHDSSLYNTLVASISGALKEVPTGTGLYDVAQAVADRIIGREE